MSKVEVIETKHRVYRPIRIILETEEEFVDVWKVLNEGGCRVYGVWNKMNVVAGDEGIKVGGGEKA